MLVHRYARSTCLENIPIFGGLVIISIKEKIPGLIFFSCHRDVLLVQLKKLGEFLLKPGDKSKIWL